MSETEAGPDLADQSRRGLSTVQIVALAVAVVFVAFIVLLATRDVQVNEPVFDNVGDPVPQFSGVSYDGQTFDMDEVLLTNRELPPDERVWTVVNFFASWCGPCRVEHPDLIRFDTQGTACPTSLVGITINDSAQNVQEFFDELGGSWPVLVGDTSGIVVDFSVLAPPETIVVAPNGVIVAKFIGAVTYDRIVEAISCA